MYYIPLIVFGILLCIILWGDIAALFLTPFTTVDWDFHTFSPLQRRQIFSVAILLLVIPTLIALNILCVLHIFTVWWWYLPLLYFSHRRPLARLDCWRPLRHCPFWKLTASYFPLTVVAYPPSTTYPPTAPYIFLAHPHGVFALSTFLTFAADGAGIDLPGVDLKAIALSSLFRTPLVSHYVSGVGGIASDSDSITEYLERGPGHALSVVLGGAAEAPLTSRPNHAIILRRRLGIFRIALHTGSSLVPVFAFGEKEIFHTPPAGPVMQLVDRGSRVLFGFASLLWRGRGVFQNSFGPLPFRHPLTVVTGTPIPVAVNRDPSESEIRELQTLYAEKLTELFDNNKETYYPGKNAVLHIYA